MRDSDGVVGLVLWATHSLPVKPGTGVLWVLTGTHPCDAPIQGRMMGTSERQLLCAWLVLACKTAHVDTSVGGSFVV